MCARFGVHLSESQLELVFGVAPEDSPLMHRDDVRPTDNAVVATSADAFMTLKWGLVPSWASDASRAANLINARSETALEKPAFRTAMAKRRCIIPVSWYTEWREETEAVELDLFGDPVRQAKPNNVKYGFALADEPLTSLAGLWDTWQSPSGETLSTFTVLTCEPNELTREFHHRMPCLLPTEEAQIWLRNDLSAAEAAELLRPVDSARMAYRRL